MRGTLLYVLIFSTVVFFPHPATGQSAERQVIASVGGSIDNGSVRADYSAGEATTHTLVSGTFMLTQGFHQPMIQEKDTTDDPPSGIHEAASTDVAYKLYPVPADQRVTLELQGSSEDYVFIALHGIDGRLIYKQDTKVPVYPGFKKVFDLRGYPSGSYLVNIFNSSGTSVKTLRFIKK